MPTPEPAPADPEPSPRRAPSGALDVDGLFDRLSATLRQLSQVKQRLRHAHDPEVGAYPVLRLVAERPRRVSDLADSLCTDVSTTSRRVSHLAHQGLVRKTRDRADQRAHVLDLTDAGRALLEEQDHRHHDWLAHVLAGWSQTDVDALAHLLGRLADDVRRRGGGDLPAPR